MHSCYTQAALPYTRLPYTHCPTHACRQHLGPGRHVCERGLHPQEADASGCSPRPGRPGELTTPLFPVCFRAGKTGCFVIQSSLCLFSLVPRRSIRPGYEASVCCMLIRELSFLARCSRFRAKGISPFKDLAIILYVHVFSSMRAAVWE